MNRHLNSLLQNMYLVNTSFHAERSVAGIIIDKVRTQLKPRMSECGLFTGVIMAEIMVDVDPDCVSFTLQGFADDLDKAMSWLQNDARPFFDELHLKYDGKTVYFTTPMKVID